MFIAEKPSEEEATDCGRGDVFIEEALKKWFTSHFPRLAAETSFEFC